MNSSCFCFRVINVPLNRARAWAPVSAAFNAISSPYWTGLGAAGGGLYFLPSPLNEVMRARGQAAWGAGGRVQPGGTHSSPKLHQPGKHISLILRNSSRELPHLSTSPCLILLPRQETTIPPSHCPSACSPHA